MTMITVAVACPGVVAAANGGARGSLPRRDSPVLPSEDKAGENGEGKVLQGQKASESSHFSRVIHRPCSLPLCKLEGQNPVSSQDINKCEECCITGRPCHGPCSHRSGSMARE